MERRARDEECLTASTYSDMYIVRAEFWMLHYGDVVFAIAVSNVARFHTLL